MHSIILVRHGYPLAWDQKLKVRGTEPHLRLDSRLADIGTQQAGLTAAHIAAGGELAAVISSPFRRCLETADAIAAAGGTTVTADWKVGEVLISQVLGNPFGPTTTMDPEWAERRAGAGKPSHPESDRTVQERVMKTMLDLKGRKPFAQRIAIVSHEIILKELVTVMTGRKPSLDWHPCAVTVLIKDKAIDRQWRLQGVPADHRHLGAADRCEPVEQIEHRYHPLDSRS